METSLHGVPLQAMTIETMEEAMKLPAHLSGKGRKYRKGASCFREHGRN